MNRCRLALLLGAGVMLLTGPPPLSGQRRDAEANPLLEDLSFLIGSWSGTINGTLGTGTGQRQYRPVVRDRYVLMTHASYRPPQQLSPAGEAHEELTIFSYDGVRDVIVLREFFLEGYVSRVDCEVRPEPWRLDCAGEAEGGGPVLPLRLTLEALDSDRFTETFEILGSDGSPAVRFVNEWLRHGSD